MGLLRAGLMLYRRAHQNVIYCRAPHEKQNKASKPTSK